MAIVAAPNATFVVARFADQLQRMIMTPAYDFGPTGQGTARRIAREKEEAKARKKAEKKRKASSPPTSRQVRRRMERQSVKAQMRKLKADLLRSKHPGGAAVASREMLDA
jgi:hypothetical protein